MSETYVKLTVLCPLEDASSFTSHCRDVGAFVVGGLSPFGETPPENKPTLARGLKHLNGARVGKGAKGQRLLAFLQEKGPIRPIDITTAFGENQKTINSRLARLRRDGLADSKNGLWSAKTTTKHRTIQYGTEQDKVLNALRARNSLTKAEDLMASLPDKNVDTIRAALVKLVNDGLARRVGGNRSGVYEVVS